MTETTKLDFRWRKTWSDAKDDFAGHDHDRSIGRIYKYQTGPQAGRWFWSMTVECRDRQHMNCDGIEDEPRQAAKRVEEVYSHLNRSRSVDMHG